MFGDLQYIALTWEDVRYILIALAIIIMGIMVLAAFVAFLSRLIILIAAGGSL